MSGKPTPANEDSREEVEYGSLSHEDLRVQTYLRSFQQPHIVDRPSVPVPVHLDQRQLSYFLNTFSHHSFHVLANAIRTPNPVYSTYLQMFMLFGNGGSCFLDDDSLSRDWLGPEMWDHQAMMTHFQMFHSSISHYGTPYAHCSNIHHCPDVVCEEHLPTTTYSSLWIFTMSLSELNHNVMRSKGGLYVLVPNLMNASGSCFSNEFRYETSRNDAELLWPCAFHKGPQFKLHRHSWIRQGHVNLVVSGVSYVITARHMCKMGECEVYHFQTALGYIKDEVSDRSLRSWFTENNYGYMPINTWNDFRNQRLSAHRYVQQTEMATLEMAWCFSAGSTMIMAPSGSEELVFVDKNLAYATSLEVGCKDRDAKLFRNVLSTMRIANRDSADRLEVDYRSFLFAVAIGFTMNARFEISLLSRMLQWSAEFRVLKSLLSFVEPQYLHAGTIANWGVRLLSLILLFYWIFVVFYTSYLVPYIGFAFDESIGLLFHFIWPIVLFVLVWLVGPYCSSVYWEFVRARDILSPPRNDVAKRHLGWFSIIGKWFGKTPFGVRPTLRNTVKKFGPRRVDSLATTVMADDAAVLEQVSVVKFHDDPDLTRYDGEGTMAPIFHESVEPCFIPDPEMPYLVHDDVTLVLKQHLNARPLDWEDYPGAKRGLQIKYDINTIEMDEKSSRMSHPDVSNKTFPVDWCVPYGPTIDLGAQVPQRNPKTLAASVIHRLLQTKLPISGPLEFSEALTSYRRVYRALHLGNKYGLPVGRVRPAHISDVIANFPLEKRARLRSAYESKTEPRNPQLSVHVKMEVLLVGSRDDLEPDVAFKKARVITAFDQDTEVAEMPFGKQYQSQLANALNGRDSVVLVCCRSHSELSKIVTAFIVEGHERARRVGATTSFTALHYDVSNWDGSTRSEVVAIEEDIDDVLDLSENYHRRLVARSLRPYRATSVYGHKIKTSCVTCSGRILTYSRNCARNAASSISSVESAGMNMVLGDSLKIVSGDDGELLSWTLVWSPENISRYVTNMSDLGHSVEVTVEHGLNSLPRAVFCSTRWIRFRRRATGSLAWYPFPQLGKLFAKLYWYANPPRDAIISIVKGDTIGYLKKFAKLRILRVFFQTVLHYLDPEMKVQAVMSERFTFTSYVNDAEEEFDECEETWADFKLVYDLDQSEIEAAIQHVIDGMNLHKTCNFDYHDWVFAHMLRIDGSGKVNFDQDL